MKRNRNESDESKKKRRYENNDAPIRVIYVTQFEKSPFQVTSKSLKSYFERAGSVEIVDYVGKPKHKFAFITFRNSEDAQKVLVDPTFHHYFKIRKADPWHQPKSDVNKGDAKGEHNSNSSDNFGLLALNNDCLLYLFSFINPVDAANLAETDDRIRLVSQMHFKKYSFFESECITVQKTNMINRVYEHIGPWITSLTFDPYLYESTDKVFEIIAKYCTNVENLIFNKIEYRQKPTARVKRFCSKIKGVEMYNCNISENTIVELFRGSTSHLESFVVRECDYFTGECFSKLTKLKTLKISSCQNVCSYQLGKALQSNQLLTEFAVFRCYEFFYFDNVKYLQNLNILTMDVDDYDYCPMDELLGLNQLKKLKIRCLEGLQIDSFLLKLGQKDMLEEFHINGLKIGEQTIEAFESLKKLTNLNLISPSNNMKEMFFKRLPTMLPQLRSLNYHDTDITMDNIMLIIKQLKLLEYLDISSYGGVTMNEVTKIIEILKTNLNRPLLHLIVSEDSFGPNSSWKKDPIMLCNKHILEIDAKSSSDDIYGYNSDDNDERDYLYD